jgi:hypothetical protein
MTNPGLSPALERYLTPTYLETAPVWVELGIGKLARRTTGTVEGDQGIEKNHDGFTKQLGKVILHAVHC